MKSGDPPVAWCKLEISVDLKEFRPKRVVQTFKNSLNSSSSKPLISIDDADEAVLQMLTIEQVMTHKPRTIPVGMTIREVAEVFAEEEFHALPVVDEHNSLIGIVTTTDLINYLLDQY